MDRDRREKSKGKKILMKVKPGKKENFKQIEREMMSRDTGKQMYTISVNQKK